MHDVCTEQHVGNVKCASLSPSLSLFPLLLLSRVHHVGADPPSVFFVTGVQSETSTIKPTTLNERAGNGHPSWRRDACNCCEPAKCRIGGVFILAMAWWMRARDSTHSIATGATRRRGREERELWQLNTGLTMFVDGPSARYNPRVLMMRRCGSSVEALIVGIKWLLVFV